MAITDLSKVGGWTIGFGKYKGLTYKELTETPDKRDYCRWMLVNNVIRHEKVKAYIMEKLNLSS